MSVSVTIFTHTEGQNQKKRSLCINAMSSNWGQSQSLIYIHIHHWPSYSLICAMMIDSKEIGKIHWFIHGHSLPIGQNWIFSSSIVFWGISFFARIREFELEFWQRKLKQLNIAGDTFYFMLSIKVLSG